MTFLKLHPPRGADVTEKPFFGLSRRAAMTVRSTASALGALLVIAAIFSGETGLSPGAGIGRGQVILSLFGALLFSAGLLGHRFPAFYKLLGKGVFSTFLALACLELTAVLLLRAGLGPQGSGSFVLRFNGFPETRYQPFVAWRGREPDSVAGPGLLLLGGSELALPPHESGGSFLASALDSLLSSRGSAGVFDHSQPYYSTPQSLVALVLELRGGSRPSEVLVLSGPGDVLTGLSTGDPCEFLGTDVFRTLTWNGTDRVFTLSELHGRAAARRTCLPSLTALLEGSGDARFLRYEPFRTLPELSPGDIEERARMIASRIGTCCTSLEALSSAFAFRGRLVWIGLHRDTDRSSSVLFDLHMRTDPLIRTLADSFPNLIVVEFLPWAPPGEEGSGYSGFDPAQSRRLAVSIVEAFR